MPNPRSSRPRNSASPSPGPNGHSTASPARHVESQIEVLYNQAVQSFVRKDHVKTQSILERLLKLLEGQKLPKTRWYTFEGVGSTPEERETEEWTIKTLKLLISSHASLYADQASSRSVGGEVSAALDRPPSAVLQHLQDSCNSALHITSEPLPPALLSTLLLASLKLKPSRDALNWAHDLAEHWITALDSTFIDAISHPVPKDNAEGARRIESAREGYLKVVELFVGEVLAREGEWEMARAFLEGEGVMGSKRRENLYRHLRSMETKSRSSASPSSSSVLPSPSSSGILPPRSPTPNGRSRSGSSSSSSSEATARPAADHRLSNGTAHGTPIPARMSNGLADRKGKAKATDVVSESSASTMPQPLPSRFVINHGSSSKEMIGRASGEPAKQGRGVLDQVMAVLPAPVQQILRRLPLRWLGVALPLPLLLIALIVALRRRKRRAHLAAPVVAGASSLAASTDALDIVRERLRQARARGVWEWVVWWLKWWISKFVGVWKMGTTITYV